MGISDLLCTSVLADGLNRSDIGGLPGSGQQVDPLVQMVGRLDHDIVGTPMPRSDAAMQRSLE